MRAESKFICEGERGIETGGGAVAVRVARCWGPLYTADTDQAADGVGQGAAVGVDNLMHANLFFVFHEILLTRWRA